MQDKITTQRYLIKGKFLPMLCHENTEGELYSLTPVLGGGWRSKPSSLPLYPWEYPCTHCRGGWVNPREGLDGCERSFLPRFDPRTVKPVASRYTDCAIPGNFMLNKTLKTLQSSGSWKQHWHIKTERLMEFRAGYIRGKPSIIWSRIFCLPLCHLK